MQPAADAMAAALEDAKIARPKPPLVANVTASAVVDPDEIRKSLVAQVTGTVRWRESVDYMSARGVTRFIEVGAGKVLAGLVKRIAEGASAISVGTPADVAAFKGSRNDDLERIERAGHCVRSYGQDRAGHWRFGRTGRRNRPRAARAGGDRRAFGHAARGARGAGRGARSARACDAVRSFGAGLGRSAGPRGRAAMGSLDILVNNAGVTRDNLFMRMKDAEWDSVLAINLTAAFRLSRAALKGMMKRRYGRIINITSIVGVTGNPGQGNYAAAKAGMIGMSKALAGEVASRGITVNCIAPGFIASPMTDALNDKQREAILASVPMGRLGAGGEIGAAAVYLASGEASYVTGQTLHVNGGMAMI